MDQAVGVAEQGTWAEVLRTAQAVRCGEMPRMPAAARGRVVARGAYLVALLGLAVAGVHALATPTVARADAGADSVLFSLTNQDRASNGVRSLAYNGTLQTIGEGGRYNGCGFPVNGRSVDMIQRNYFAHPILGCGQYVFSIMQAYGIHYLSAGENIAWNNVQGAASSAAAANVAFMNSPEHRANILDAAYTDLGVGSDTSGSAGWTGAGGSVTGVWMFSEEFAQLHAAAAPKPPPPPPAPKPAAPKPGQSTVSAPTRNSAAPAPPAQPPVTTAVPTAAPTAAPAPTATPGPTPLPTLTLPPPVEAPGGLLFNSVESVLESYLIG